MTLVTVVETDTEAIAEHGLDLGAGVAAARRLVARALTPATNQVILADTLRYQQMQFDDLTLTTLLKPKWRLLLIGAGQLSLAVSQMTGCTLT